MQARLVQAGDHVIEVFVHGSGAQTLIMAAGNGRPATQPDRLASEMAGRGLRVATYNYRGIGQSTGDGADLTLVNLADDVWAIADSLGAAKVHLAGKTFGNRVMRVAKDADEGTYPVVARNQTSASDRTPAETWQRGGTAPMLAITCLLDRMGVPENALNIGKSRPDTWVAGLPGCGHNMVNERPDVIRDLIMEFIRRHPAG